VSAPYLRAIVKGELKRARKVGGHIDRGYLKRETRLSSRAGEQQLEALISTCALELIAEESTVARRK
jgi:hypothetical protein